LHVDSDGEALDCSLAKMQSFQCTGKGTILFICFPMYPHPFTALPRVQLTHFQFAVCHTSGTRPSALNHRFHGNEVEQLGCFCVWSKKTHANETARTADTTWREQTKNNTITPAP